MENVLTKSVKVKSFNVGYDGKVKLSFILNNMQEIAGAHAARLGVSVIDLHARNLTWVLSRYHIKIDHCPEWNDEIILRTWPHSKEKHFALREFEICDVSDNLLLKATSSWMIMDLTTRKPVRPGDVLNDYPVRPVRMIDDPFKSLPVNDSYENKVEFKVRLNDLDVNKHVNHTVYVDWAFEAIPLKFRREKMLTEIEIAYRGEALLEDNVMSYSNYNSEGDHPEYVYLHQIIRQSDMKELTRLRTRWINK